MKRLIGALIAAVLVGVLAWVKLNSKPPQVRALEPDPPGALLDLPGKAPEVPVAIVTPSEADPPEPAPDQNIPEPPGAVLPKPKALSLAAVEELPPHLEASETGKGLPPVTALENMRATVRQYSQRFGGNPVGDNAEITAALNGRNPKRVVFLNPEDGWPTNDKGQLVDAWGTPYFFHALSRTEMEIRSAGPDRRLWSRDDLVMK